MNALNFTKKAVFILLLFNGISIALCQTSEWRLIYEHNENGESISGSKEQLIEAVRQGKEVRIGWKMGGATQYVEHYASAQFLSIMEGEVYGQITPILSQKPEFDNKVIGFREGLKWSFIASTTGTNATFFYNFQDGVPIDKSRYKWGNKWFVKG